MIEGRRLTTYAVVYNKGVWSPDPAAPPRGAEGSAHVKTALLLVLIVSAIAIAGLLWRSRRAASRNETTSPPMATTGVTGATNAAFDTGRHRGATVATDAGAPLVRDPSTGGAHRA